MADNDKSIPFIVDSILPAREIHLIFGPIIEDCTMLTLQIIDDWRHGRLVFGSESHPEPFVYVACNKSPESLGRAMSVMGIDPQTFPCISLNGSTRPEDHNVAAALAIARRKDRRLTVLILDGMLSLCPGRINDHKDSSRFLRETLALCRKEKITIIGCVTTSKSKEGAGYLTARDRMHGSTAWYSESETKILIEPTRPSDLLNPLRTVMLIPPLDMPQRFQYSRENGPLRFVGNNITDQTLDGWLASESAGSAHSTQDLRNLAAQFSVSNATLYRWIREQVEVGALTKSKHGIYIVSERARAQ